MSNLIAGVQKMWRRDGAFDTLTTPKASLVPPSVTQAMLSKIERDPTLRQNLAEANRIRKAMMKDAGEIPNDLSWMSALQKQAAKDEDSQNAFNHEAKAAKQVAKDQGETTDAEITRIVDSANLN